MIDVIDVNDFIMCILNNTKELKVSGKAYDFYNIITNNSETTSYAIAGSLIFPFIGTIIGAAVGMNKDEKNLRLLIGEQYPELNIDKVIEVWKSIKSDYSKQKLRRHNAIILIRNDIETENK